MGVSSSESHDLTAFYEMLSASFGVLSQNTGFYPSLDRIAETMLGPLNLGPGGGSYNKPISHLHWVSSMYKHWDRVKGVSSMTALAHQFPPPSSSGCLFQPPQSTESPASLDRPIGAIFECLIGSKRPVYTLQLQYSVKVATCIYTVQLKYVLVSHVTPVMVA